MDEQNIVTSLAIRYRNLLPYLEKNKLEAFRLYNYESNELPLTIDIYQKNAVINFYDEINSSQVRELEDAIEKIFKSTSFYYKDRSRKELKLPKSGGKQEIIITESGNKFLVNLSDYQDTGIFLDHRETRKWVAEHSKDKIILNTFAYSGSFTIYAAKGGAQKTYSVDLSATYCDWIRKNLQLNDLSEEQNWIYKMDTLEFFKYAAKKNLKFDIIIIDPPTFSKNKKKSFSVQKDHPLLINAASALLNPDGMIIFSNNYRDFKLKKDTLIPRNIIERDFIPPDFPFQSYENKIHHCFIIKNQ